MRMQEIMMKLRLLMMVLVCSLSQSEGAKASVSYTSACTDPAANNALSQEMIDLYADVNTIVTTDNTLCVYNTGCTNPNGLNYDPEAVSDTGLCIFVFYGPSTPITQNDAFSILETTCGIAFDQSVVTAVAAAATNNLNLSSINEITESLNGTLCLTFDEEFEAELTQPVYQPVCGNPLASNYSDLVGTSTGMLLYVQDNSLCVFDEGCMDAGALNFEASAVSDDGSCVFLSGGGEQMVSPEAAQQIFLNTCPNGALAGAVANAIAQQGGWTLTELNNLVLGITGSPCFVIPQPYVPVGLTNGIEYVGGCTDSGADNYNPNADFDDGSCQAPTCY